MTALAMIIGMVPMALGMGDGGEQNAPLGRAVIGGLLCATVATLVFVPCCLCSILHSGDKRKSTVQLNASEAAPCLTLTRNTPNRFTQPTELEREGMKRLQPEPLHVRTLLTP